MVQASDLTHPQAGYHYAEIPAAPKAPTGHANAVEVDGADAVMLDVEIAGAGQLMDLTEFLAVTSSTALVVAVEGTVVFERYFGGVTAQDRLMGNSATKSVLALITGAAVYDGRLADLDAAVTDYVPELAASGYASASLRHLLTMTTGLDWDEDYRDPNGRPAELMTRWRRGEGGVRELLQTIPSRHPPGTRYAYCSPDSMVLDWVRERATGQTFAAAAAELWRRVGAGHPALVALDAAAEDGGVAMAAAGFAAAARDWARVGALQVDGSCGEDRIVGPDWVASSSRPGEAFLAPGCLPSTITTHAGFGFHWWPLDRAGTQVMADGMRGQFVYVDRVRRAVVVKMSAWPYADPWWDRQCRDLCYVALPLIAEAAVLGLRGDDGSSSVRAPTVQQD